MEDAGRKRSSTLRDASPSPPPVRRQKIESTTTTKAVAAFFTPLSLKEPDKTSWHVLRDTLLVGRYKPQGQSQVSKSKGKCKIAAFDLDSTLIKTISGNAFAKDANDWQWWHGVVPTRIKQLAQEGFSITIITNQGRLNLKTDTKTPKSDLKSLTTFKNKAGSILAQLDLAFTLFAATGRDGFRKPRTSIWEEVLEEYGIMNSADLDLKNCVFVGDAGGRAARHGAKADHACSDRNFAENVGIPFQTPEEFFLGEESQPFCRDFEPRKYLNRPLSVSSETPPVVIKKRNPLDIVIMCGSPAAGKSSFYWRHLAPIGYERVNQDILRTRENCVKVAMAHLAEHRSVAVDNTNADRQTRAVWVSLAHKMDVPIRCVYFTAPSSLCEHNDTVRALAGLGFNPEKRAILPHSAFSSYTSRFQKPKLMEGFHDIVNIDFQFHGTDEQCRIWSQYWI